MRWYQFVDVYGRGMLHQAGVRIALLPGVMKCSRVSINEPFFM